jgi:hypothetical protein
MSFRGRIFQGSQAYPPEAAKFILAAGISFTTSQKRALGYLVNGLTELGIGAVGSNFLIYPFIGGGAASHALNLFFPTTTIYNVTWVGSPTHDSTGVSFNGTTQYGQLPSFAISNLTPNLTTANVSMAFCTSNMGGGTYIPMGFAMPTTQQTKTYSTAGNFSFVPSTEAPGVTNFTISAFGGGGGGGGNITAGNFSGGGGGGGNYATRAVTLSSLSTAISITVGSGGQANTGAAGGIGGDSTITHPNITTVTAKGGLGGNPNTAGARGAAVAAQAGNLGTTTFNGGGGAAGGTNAGRGAGGGGSSAGTAVNGNLGTTPTNTSGGAGGIAVAGGVAGGAGGGANVAGTAGPAGGGGGGGAGASTATSRAGGAGGAGKVTVSWSAPVQKRFSMSIFNAGTSNNQIFNADVGGDATSRFSYQSSPLQLNGVRAGSRRANTGASTDMGFYVQNNAGGPVNGPIVMSTTSFDPSPLFYIGAINSWGGNTGNAPGNLYVGTINFALIGPGLSNAQLQGLYTLIVGYNTILGR